ncbi:MAG: hypothetical protein KY449_11000 [Proteobacteria bacterium]|nr:hypothetical protein [Pseudomonadota bacterium]
MFSPDVRRTYEVQGEGWPGLAGYQRRMQMDHHLRMTNQHRLRELKRRQGGAVTMMCLHEPKELETLQARAASRGGRQGQSGGSRTR